jgi:hypothetical protein
MYFSAIDLPKFTGFRLLGEASRSKKTRVGDSPNLRQPNFSKQNLTVAAIFDVWEYKANGCGSKLLHTNLPGEELDM